MLRDDTLQHAVFDQLEPARFFNSEIRDVIDQMKVDRSIKPIGRLWQIFTSYQHLYDKTFTHECIFLIYLLYMPQQTRSDNMLQGSPEHLLHLLDAYTDGTDGESEQFKELLVYEKIDPDDIARRYFVIKRLQKTMLFMETVCKNLFNKDMIKQIIYDEIKSFEQISIKNALINVCIQERFEPFLHIWQECQQYRYAADDSFLQEMLRSILLIYRALLLKQLSKETEQLIISEMEHVLEVYENLDKLPLDEALNAIDVTTETLIAIQNMQLTEHRKNIFMLLPGILICGLFMINHLFHITDY